jgi:hypothetical protein
MTWHISPTPTCIGKFREGVFCGGELWVSGTFGTDPRNDMADWLANRSFDVQVARLELCCPSCCRIFETSTSNKFRAGGVHAVAFRDIDVKQLLGLPSLLISVSLSFWPQGVPQVPHDDVTSSAASKNLGFPQETNEADSLSICHFRC